MTSEQLEASRAERMRQNGHGVITLEDARTWMEETGLCLFLPKRQFVACVVPTFVEAVIGQQNPTPDPHQIALAEELLIRLEKAGVVVRLNLLGQPGEQQDFIVATWVLPYIYALRGDRDWRRSPQLTGSRQVSPLAVQTYKLLEAGEETVDSLKHALGREVTEAAVLRAITELWQQLRIIPIITAKGEPARWQLLRTRYQKAIAEGASTSQVTAISVLASIYLQAVIATTMEDVEVYLSPLTARSKVREVLRGLVATRQVHTIPLGHAPHFYVAGTLPEFSTPPTYYASSSMASSSYFFEDGEHEEKASPAVSLLASADPIARVALAAKVDPAAVKPEPVVAKVAPEAKTEAAAAPAVKPAPQPEKAEKPAPRSSAVRKPAPAAKSSDRPRFSRPAVHGRDRKPASSSSFRSDSRGGASRPSGSRPAGSRPAGSRPSSSQHSRPAASRWNAESKSGNQRPAARPSAAKPARPGGKPAAHAPKPGDTKSALNHRASVKPAARKAAPAHKGAPARGARPAHKPSMGKASAGKRFGYAAASRTTKSAKKRG